MALNIDIWLDGETKMPISYFEMFDYGDKLRTPPYSWHMFRPYNANIFRISNKAQYFWRLFWRGE